MRSIERRFNDLQKKRPELSSFMNSTHAVRGQGFTKDAISRWFNKLVDKDDYSNSDKKELLQHIISLTNEPEDNRKQG